MSLVLKINLLFGLVVPPILASLAGYDGFAGRLLGGLCGWYGVSFIAWLFERRVRAEQP